MIPLRKLRKRLRLRLFLPKINFNYLDVPLRKYNSKINMAFCFDGNIVKQVSVAILSLITSAHGRCDYNIFCIVDESVSDQDRKILKNIVSETGSDLTFLDANHDFDKSWLDNFWPIGIYYRLMLPKLLPDISQIIYADYDVMFCNDLIEADMIDMKDNLIAGVPTNKAKTINSGFLIMNLKQIRKERLYDKWIEVSQKERFHYPDQTLLRETCKGRTLYLPWKYNFMPNGLENRQTILNYTEKEYNDLKYYTIMIHWAGARKPWNSGVLFSKKWHEYAKINGTC